MDTRLEVKDVHVTLVYYCNEETRDRIKHGKIPTLPQPYELGTLAFSLWSQYSWNLEIITPYLSADFNVIEGVADIDGDSQKINRTWIYGEKTVKGDEKMRSPFFVYGRCQKSSLIQKKHEIASFPFCFEQKILQS